MRVCIRNILLLVTACLIITLGCRDSQPPASLDKKGPGQALSAPHPRLLFTPAKQESLRAVLESSHKWLWARYIQDLPGKLKRAAEPFPEALHRGQGDLAPDLCFAWLMTGDKNHLEAARGHLMKLARTPQWDPSNDLIHGHLLLGMALAYDWLYGELKPDERKLVAGRLALAAEKQYQRMTTGRIWYRTQYFQNHGQTNFCGLAYAAAALYDENPGAVKWLRICEDYFDTVFRLLPPDGTSVEDISYGMYGLDFIIRYAELARSLLGRNYCDNPWFKNSPDYIIHSLVPAPTEKEYAITFGDAPRNMNWHGPEPQLFWAASEFDNAAAQWAGRHLIELNPEGLGSAAWMALLWYDPKVSEAGPAAFPTFKHFTDNGQVMMRSSWTDPEGMLVGFKCGPFMGRAHSADALFDWGSSHSHPDEGSFQIFAHGKYLAIDPLYTGCKLTANHNTMMFKGEGQLGNKIVWMAVAEAVEFKHYPEVVHAVSTDEYDYVAAEAARAYHPALGLKQFTRHLAFIKPDILLVADQIELSEKGVLYNYAPGELEVSGGFEHGYAGYATGTGGEASTVFRGKPGSYRMSVIYLDNYPGSGEYSFTLDGEPFHPWKNTVQDTDNHCTVSLPVGLETGSRIGVRCSRREQDYRVIKFSVFSDKVKTERKARWLLHFDPAAEVEQHGSRLVTATLGSAALDVHTLLQGMGMGSVKVDTYDVKEARIEPFTFRQTRRLVLEPVFHNGKATLLSLLHARPADGPRLEGMGAGMSQAGIIKVHWELGGKKTELVWNLINKQFWLRLQ
ncbi:MAG: DUF4962 domain-containing protein [Gemmatimonadota bacterium]|nr:DUF4962 domain-containing protein [Gemmatimonadota bacterium]